MARILAIDPSVNSLGWALLDVVPGRQRTWKWGLIKPEGHNFVQKLNDICGMISLECGHFDELVVEWPTFFNNARGHTAAVQGYTINLAAICAYIGGYFHIEPNRFFLLTATEWKGSVSKQVTMRRFLKRFGTKWFSLDHNVVDAIMLLHHHAIRKEYVDKLSDPASETFETP